MSVLGEIKKREHQEVVFHQDKQTGVLSITAIHDTTLGPALGGCRMRKYASIEEALYDVLKLSEAMTYKNSLAGLNVGGGKCVLLTDHTVQEGRKGIFQNFGKFLNTLNGQYITAEDMGTSVSDMSTIQSVSKFVCGRDPKDGGGGDPSPYTAQGLFAGIRACLERYFGSGDYKGKHFVIQGVGHVGERIVKLLAEAGGKLTIYDTSSKVTARVCKEYGAEATTGEQIMSLPCDVFVPCAVGGIINAQTVNKLQCKIVAGAANNQLEGGDTETILSARGIMYAPDFAINAGGVILCADELEEGGFTPKRVNERVEQIYHTVSKILDESKKTSIETGKIAIRLAKERIEKARK